MKSACFITFIAITVLQFSGLAQGRSEGIYHYTYLPNFEFKIESGLSQLLIHGDYSLKYDSEISSKLDHIELIDYSENRQAKSGFFLGAGVNYHLNRRFSVGLMYKVERDQEVNEKGSISSIKVIGPNTITTKSVGNYSMKSELNNATLMASGTVNFFIAKMNRSNIVLNCGLSAGYSNIKATTQVPNAQCELSMYSESFQPHVKTVGSVAKEKAKEQSYCWSVFSNVSFEFIKAPNLSIGYRFTRLGEITLIEKSPESVNLIQSYMFNNEQNSNTKETLSLVSTNSRLKLFSHNFSISIIF